MTPARKRSPNGTRKAYAAGERSGSESRQVVPAIKLHPAEVAQIDRETAETHHLTRVSYIRSALSVYRHVRERNARAGLATCADCGAGVSRDADECPACGVV